MADKIVLVTGATGRQGGATARHLLKQGWRVRGLTRNPESPAAKRLTRSGVEMVYGDMEKPETLRAAMRNVYGVFSVQNFWEKGVGYEGEVRQGKHVVTRMISGHWPRISSDTPIHGSARNGKLRAMF